MISVWLGRFSQNYIWPFQHHLDLSVKHSAMLELLHKNIHTKPLVSMWTKATWNELNWPIFNSAGARSLPTDTDAQTTVPQYPMRLSAKCAYCESTVDGAKSPNEQTDSYIGGVGRIDVGLWEYLLNGTKLENQPVAEVSNDTQTNTLVYIRSSSSSEHSNSLEHVTYAHGRQ